MIEVNGQKLNHEEEKILQKAVELHSLLLMGQFSKLGEYFFNLYKNSNPAVVEAIQENLQRSEDVFPLSQNWDDLFHAEWPERVVQSNSVENKLNGNNFISNYLESHLRQQFCHSEEANS